MYNTDGDTGLSGQQGSAADDLNLRGKMEKAQRDEDEIAAGLLNVMLHRLHQLGRGHFEATDYQALRYSLETMIYLAAPGPKPKASQLVTQEERQALAGALAAEPEPKA